MVLVLKVSGFGLFFFEKKKQKAFNRWVCADFAQIFDKMPAFYRFRQQNLLTRASSRRRFYCQNYEKPFLRNDFSKICLVGA